LTSWQEGGVFGESCDGSDRCGGRRRSGFRGGRRRLVDRFCRDCLLGFLRLVTFLKQPRYKKQLHYQILTATPPSMESVSSCSKNIPSMLMVASEWTNELDTSFANESNKNVKFQSRQNFYLTTI
jgi:hypothetical protein